MRSDPPHPPPPLTFLSFPFWETQQGHVRSEDQTSHLQLAPPALRTCDKQGGGGVGGGGRREEPLEEGVSRFMEGGDKVIEMCRTQITGLCHNRPRTGWVSLKRGGHKWF